VGFAAASRRCPSLQPALTPPPRPPPSTPPPSPQARASPSPSDLLACSPALAAARLRAPLRPGAPRRALSLDAGFAAAREQAGLEAALERIALAHPPPASEALGDAGADDAASAAGGDDDAGSTAGDAPAWPAAQAQPVARLTEREGAGPDGAAPAAAAAATRWAPGGGLLAAHG
jgi:hypothetical protein